MARFTLPCLVLLLCSSLLPYAVLPSVSPTANHATIPDTASPVSLVLPEQPLLPHYNNYFAEQSASNDQSTLEKRDKLSEPLFPQPDKIADFVNDTVVNEAVRQIIWKGEIGGLQNLYKPTRSIVPTMFTLLNETAGVVRELIMLADALGTISVETSTMWSEMRTGYASWAEEMRTPQNNDDDDDDDDDDNNNNNKTIASIAGVPEDLEHLSGELARPLLREAILIGARGKVGRDDAAGRMAIVESALQDWRAAAAKISPPSPTDAPPADQQRLLNAATRMETAYNRTERSALDNMHEQNATLHASSAFLRGEMARLNTLLADRITTLRRQQAWYSQQLYTAAAASSSSSSSGNSNASNASNHTGLSQLQHAFAKINAWLPEAQARAPAAVAKAAPEVRVVEVLLRDRQIRQSAQLAGWRVSMRKPLRKIQEVREGVRKSVEEGEGTRGMGRR